MSFKSVIRRSLAAEGAPEDIVFCRLRLREASTDDDASVTPSFLRRLQRCTDRVCSVGRLVTRSQKSGSALRP